MSTKKCTKCGIEKELTLDNFYWQKTRNRWRAQCILCTNKQSTEYNVKNQEEIKQQRKGFRQNNKEELKEQDARKYKNDTVKIKQRIKEYKAKPENKTKRNLNSQKRRQNDPNFKLRNDISVSIRAALQRNGSSKNGQSIMEYLHYTIEQLKNYLENQFENWMTWDNWTVYDPKTWDDLNPATWTWQLDHIKPHSTFNYTLMEDQEFRDCWALSNLRPYSAKQNLIDGSTRIRHQKT